MITLKRILWILFFCFATSVNAQVADSVLIAHLEQIDFKAYEGKTVREFLKDKRLRKYRSSKVFFSDPTCYLSNLSLGFSNFVSVKIFVKDYQYVNRYSANLKWSMRKFKKEKIYRIVLKYPRILRFKK